MSQSGAGSAGAARRRRPLGSSGSTLSARLAAAAAANDANQPSLFGLLAGRRLAKQFANRVYAKRASADPQRVEPTYRMDPVRKFDPKRVEAVIKEITETRMAHFTYSARMGVMMTKVLCEEIKEAVKELGYDRYKIICLATIGEKRNQDLLVTSRCTWDLRTDNSASYAWQNTLCFCTATVYGMYHE